MAALNLLDWISYNSITGYESTYPIMIAKKIHDQDIKWTADHYVANKSLTVAGHYNIDHDAAYKKRLNIFDDAFQEAITFMRASNKKPPFTYSINTLTDKGRLQRLIYIVAVTDRQRSFLLISDTPNPLV